MAKVHDDFLLSPGPGSEEEHTDSSQPPVDRGNVIYLCMLLLGCGLLFPYNAMLTASDYFDHIWEGKGLSSFAPFLSNCLSPFLQLFMVRFSHVLPFRLRALGGFSLYTISVILVPIVAESIKNREQSYIIAMILLIIIGASNAILSSTIFYIGAMFPPKYSQAVMAGNGWSGLIVCLIRIATKAVFKEDDSGYRNSAYCFFGASSFVCLLCIAAYLYVVNAEFTKFYFVEKQQEKKSSSSINQSLLDEDQYQIDKEEQPGMIPVLGKLWPAVLNVVMVFIMTFLVYPGALFSHELTVKWVTKSWWPVTATTIFNVFDLIGRSAPAYFIAFSAENLHIPIFARFLLYPFFVLLGPSHLLNSTYGLIGILVLFSVSNGYLSTLCFIHSGSYVKDNERAIAGGIMSIGLISGITTGSLIANFISNNFF